MIKQEKQVLEDFLSNYKKFADTLIEILDHVRDNGVWTEEDEQRYTTQVPMLFKNLKFHSEEYKKLLKTLL